MHYAISYVSTVSPNTALKEIEILLEHTRRKNNTNKITGILLYSNGNFSQVIEGEKAEILQLFAAIEKDARHYDLIPVFKKEIKNPQFNSYKTDFLSLDSAYNADDLDLYLSQVEKLDTSIQSSVRYILKNFS